MYSVALIGQMKAALKDATTAIADARVSRAKAKYLDADRSFQKAWRQASRVRLTSSPPLRILNIGAKAGYFSFIASQLGHDCVSIERPGIDLFRRLWTRLGIEVLEHQIVPHERLPRFDTRFHLTTASGSTFKAVGTERGVFTTADWAFFLNDLRDNVIEPGEALVVWMDEQYPDNTALADLFRSRGATQERPREFYFSPLI